jgi:YbbR domain-containing protein
MNNLGLKVLSLFLAFAVWLFVSAPRRERVIERALAAPLSLVNMPRNLLITTSVPDTISVRVRGRVSDVRALSSQNLEVPLNLGGLVSGDTTVNIPPQAINVPLEIEVVSIDPTKIRFRAEQLRQKVVPIRPFLVGQPHAGYVTGDPSIAPEHALVSGPASQIQHLSEVATERIIMTGRTDTFAQNVAVVSDSSLIRVIEPLVVTVTVPLTPEVGPQKKAE